MTHESQDPYFDHYENNYFDYGYNYEKYDHSNHFDETYEIQYEQQNEKFEQKGEQLSKTNLNNNSEQERK